MQDGCANPQAIGLLHAQIESLVNRLLTLKHDGKAALAVARLDELALLCLRLFELLMALLK